jgi:hypothetical protein
VKAKLTVHGFKDVEADELTTFAGTATRWGQRFIVATSAQMLWCIATADVGSAFLRGLTFQQLAELTGQPVRKASFQVPRGYETFIQEIEGMGHFSPLLHELVMDKAIYGLKDAPRAWRKRLHQALLQLHARQMKCDAAIYMWHDSSGSLVLIVSTHVDDLKITGTDKMISYLLDELTKMFGKLKVHRGSFEHCGIIHEQQADRSIVCHQNHYCKGLHPVCMATVDISKPETPLTPSQHSDFLSLLGGLSWLNQTRLDCCIYTQALQRAAQKPTVAHLVRLNCVVRWVKRKPATLLYAKLQGEIKVLDISDAAFRREDKSGLAMRGAVIAISESHSSHPGGRVQIIDWYSRRQRRVVRSTFGAELNALVDSLEVAKLLAFALAEIRCPKADLTMLRGMEESGEFPIAIEACIDCKSIYDALATEDTKTPSEASLIMILLQCKESLRSGLIRKIWWIDTRDMAADALNKGLVARSALLMLSSTGVWNLLHPALGHSEAIKH